MTGLLFVLLTTTMSPPLDALLDAKPAVVHVDQPLKPAMIPHAADWGLGDRCAMCVGNHAVNYHKLTQKQLGAIGYQDWARYHAGLHRDSARVTGTRSAAAVTTHQNPAGQRQSGVSGNSSGVCPGGVCNRPIRSLLFGRRR